MILVQNIKCLSVNRVAKGRPLRKSGHRTPGGPTDEAWLTYQCTAEILSECGRVFKFSIRHLGRGYLEADGTCAAEPLLMHRPILRICGLGYL